MEMTRLTNESDDYRKAREQLRLAEIELVHQREEVAAMRRALPPGPVVDDYEFVEGPRSLDDGDDPLTTVRLSELFSAPDRPLVVYQLMYGKAQTEACPMCTQWIDGFNGVVHHIARNVDFAVVAAADPATLRAHARDRHWDRLRLLSCADNTFKHDLGSEDADGGQDSMVSVFVRDADGAIRHTYSGQPRLADDIGERGIDLLAPTWHVLDLTPQGRGDWYSSLSYGLSTVP
jgi:predicted dithiol-disulfide oxidoreductase (DUF899 family)